MMQSTGVMVRMYGLRVCVSLPAGAVLCLALTVPCIICAARGEADGSNEENEEGFAWTDAGFDVCCEDEGHKPHHCRCQEIDEEERGWECGWIDP